jgi:multicomponent Na+:H+ antiporter subunit F
MVQISLYISMAVLSASMILVLVRLWTGPDLGDRVISLDVLMTMGIAYIVVYSMMSGKSVFIDVAVILGLIAFLTTVAFSFYMERRGR